MFFNNEFKYYRRQDGRSLFLKDSYTKEELEALYNNVYLYNLKQILKYGYSRYAWRDVEEINVVYGPLVKDYTANGHNSYLKDMTDKLEFGKELNEIGFYMPVYVNRLDDGKLMAEGGKHRITSAKMLEAQGLWNGRKIFTIENDNMRACKMTSVKENLPERTPYPLIMRMPMQLFFTVDYPSIDEKAIKEKLDSIDATMLDGDIVEFSLDKTALCYRCLALNAYWISEMFHVYKVITGDIIQPSPVLNDKEYFERWISE